MAAYFWVGGTGTWSGTGNTQFAVTSGGTATLLNPTNADTVTFDANSGTAATVTCTATAVSLSTTINKAGITILLSGSPTLCTAAGTCTLTNGTLNLAGFVLSTGLFNSSNANVRTITTGAGSFTVTGNNATVWQTGNATNLTYTSGVPTVNATFSGSVGTRVFSTSGTVDRLNLNITAGSDIIAPASTFIVNNYNFTGFSGTLTNVSSIIFGSLTLSSTMTVSAGANTFEFRGVSGTNTITSAGKTMDFPILFNNTGITFQLQDALTSGATRTVTLTNGALDLNGFTLTTGLFNSSNSNTRTLAFGTAKIVLTATSGTLFTTSTATGLTVTGTNPLIQAIAGGAGTRSITIGAAGEANAISVDVTTGSDIISLGTTSGSYKNVNFTGFTGTVSVGNSILVFGNWNYGGTTIQGVGGGTVTFSATSGTKTITSNGFSFPGNVTFSGVGGTFQLQDNLTLISTAITTLTAGTLNLNNFTVTTGIFGGAGSGVRQLITNSVPIIVTGNATSVVAFGTTTNLTGDVAPTFNLNYSGSTGTRTISWGSSNLIYVPNINVTAGSDIVTTGGTSTVNNFNFTGFTGTLGNATRNIFGNLTLVSGMATPSSGSLVNTFIGVSSQTITTAGQTLDFPVTFNGIGGTFACQDALTLGSTRALTMTNGALQLKSGTTNTVGSFNTTGTNQKFLSATTPGTQATLSDASGTNSVSHLTIKDSNATGGAIFNATDATNVNAGNNLGWDFSDVAVGGSGNTFAFGFGFRI